MLDIIRLSETFEHYVDVAKCKCYNKDDILKLNKIKSELAEQIELATIKVKKINDEKRNSIL